jgi:hypothetical protein
VLKKRNFVVVSSRLDRIPQLGLIHTQARVGVVSFAHAFMHQRHVGEIDLPASAVLAF